MLHITQEHVVKFRRMKELFLSKTRVPAEGNWKSKSSNDIWMEIVAQVVVVGRSDPWDRLKSNVDLKNRISWDSLLKIQNQDEIKKTINQVLLSVGTRYASHDISKSIKAKALSHNFNALKSFEYGPKGFLEKLSEFNGVDADRFRIRSVMSTLMYIKNKGARDLLMELGLVRNAIALDVRVQTVLQEVGIEFSEGFQSNPKLYDEVETDLLTKVCAPLGISGVEFDRMLYQNYQRIIGMQL